MEHAEWAPGGLREFGLDPPGYTAILFRGDISVLGAEFGAANPQKVLQYMKLQGRDQVYLMSRFIGEEWERALRGAAEPNPPDRCRILESIGLTLDHTIPL